MRHWCTPGACVPHDLEWSPGLSPNKPHVYCRFPPVPLDAVFYSAADPTLGHAQFVWRDGVDQTDRERSPPAPPVCRIRRDLCVRCVRKGPRARSTRIREAFGTVLTVRTRPGCVRRALDRPRDRPLIRPCHHRHRRCCGRCRRCGRRWHRLIWTSCNCHEARTVTAHLLAEVDVDPHCPEERCGTPQATRQRTGGGRPGFSVRDSGAGMLAETGQEVGRRPGPVGPVSHPGADGRCHLVCLDHAIHHLRPVSHVGVDEGTGWPHRRLTRGRPAGEVGHAGVAVELGRGELLKPVDQAIE